MSKEEIRRELGIYDGHTFEDSPPITKKAKYQPGRRSTVTLYISSTHVLLQNFWYLVLVPRLFPVFLGRSLGTYVASYSHVTRRGSDAFLYGKKSLCADIALF